VEHWTHHQNKPLFPKIDAHNSKDDAHNSEDDAPKGGMAQDRHHYLSMDLGFSPEVVGGGGSFTLMILSGREWCQKHGHSNR
jgi:hypothetical protein